MNIAYILQDKINSKNSEVTQVGYILQKYTLDKYTLERAWFPVHSQRINPGHL